jgi:hypothetical protein
MELLAGLAATEDEVPHDNDPRTAVMRTIHSSKFSTENSLRQICSRLWMSLVLSAIRGSLSSKAKQWFERTRVRLMRSGSVVGSLWPPLLIRPRLWRSLPLFPVKKFNVQEMDGRTLKVEIAKWGAGGKDDGYRSSAGHRVATRTEKWWSELDDAG